MKPADLQDGEEDLDVSIYGTTVKKGVFWKTIDLKCAKAAEPGQLNVVLFKWEQELPAKMFWGTWDTKCLVQD